jgi:hypothetical protein
MGEASDQPRCNLSQAEYLKTALARLCRREAAHLEREWAVHHGRPDFRKKIVVQLTVPLLPRHR